MKDFELPPITDFSGLDLLPILEGLAKRVGLLHNEDKGPFLDAIPFAAFASPDRSGRFYTADLGADKVETIVITECNVVDFARTPSTLSNELAQAFCKDPLSTLYPEQQNMEWTPVGDKVESLFPVLYKGLHIW